MKPLIFVSHIHAHRDVVKVLTDEIHKLLPNAVKFFVSSDGQSIPGGDDWLDAIEDAIKRAAIALIICTEESVGRPWIQFEAGGAWFAGKRVVPLCFGAMTPERLPQPLASRQAFSAADPKDLEALVSLIAKQAELEAPPFNAPGLAEKLANALSMAPTRAAVDPDSQGETPAEPTPPTADTPTELSVRDDVYKPLHTGLKALLADLTETPYPTQILYDQEDSLGAKRSYRIWHDMVEAGQASRLDAIGQQSLRARLDALAEPVDAYNAVMKTAHRVIRNYLRQGHSDYAPSGSESDEKNGWDYPEIRHELIDNEAHEFHKWGGYDSPTADFVNSSGGRLLVRRPGVHGQPSARRDRRRPSRRLGRHCREAPGGHPGRGRTGGGAEVGDPTRFPALGRLPLVRRLARVPCVDARSIRAAAYARQDRVLATHEPVPIPRPDLTVRGQPTRPDLGTIPQPAHNRMGCLCVM